MVKIITFEEYNSAIKLLQDISSAKSLDDKEEHEKKYKILLEELEVLNSDGSTGGPNAESFKKRLQSYRELRTIHTQIIIGISTGFQQISDKTHLAEKKSPKPEQLLNHTSSEQFLLKRKAIDEVLNRPEKTHRVTNNEYEPLKKRLDYIIDLEESIPYDSLKDLSPYHESNLKKEMDEIQEYKKMLQDIDIDAYMKELSPKQKKIHLEIFRQDLESLPSGRVIPASPKTSHINDEKRFIQMLEIAMINAANGTPRSLLSLLKEMSKVDQAYRNTSELEIPEKVQEIQSKAMLEYEKHFLGFERSKKEEYYSLIHDADDTAGTLQAAHLDITYSQIPPPPKKQKRYDELRRKSKEVLIRPADKVENIVQQPEQTSLREQLVLTKDKYSGLYSAPLIAGIKPNEQLSADGISLLLHILSTDIRQGIKKKGSQKKLPITVVSNKEGLSKLVNVMKDPRVPNGAEMTFIYQPDRKQDKSQAAYSRINHKTCVKLKKMPGGEFRVYNIDSTADPQHVEGICKWINNNIQREHPDLNLVFMTGKKRQLSDREKPLVRQADNYQCGVFAIKDAFILAEERNIEQYLVLQKEHLQGAENYYTFEIPNEFYKSTQSNTTRDALNQEDGYQHKSWLKIEKYPNAGSYADYFSKKYLHLVESFIENNPPQKVQEAIKSFDASELTVDQFLKLQPKSSPQSSLK